MVRHLTLCSSNREGERDEHRRAGPRVRPGLGRGGGARVTEKLDWAEVEVRDFGATAIAIGVHAQVAKHQGNPVNGRFRATHVLVRDEDRWRLAGMRLSPIGGAAPFVPVRLANGVTLDYLRVDRVTSQHYAFLVGEDDFDAAMARIERVGPV